MKADDFYSRHCVQYPQRIDRAGYLSIGVLEFLQGLPWDDLALGYVHALRPTSIRVVRGEETCDAQTWRVTVYVDEKNIITGVRQECEVWLPGDVQHGADLRDRLGACRECGVREGQAHDAGCHTGNGAMHA